MNYLENGETDCSELGLDILNTVLDIKDVDYNGDNLSYIEEVVICLMHNPYLFFYLKHQTLIYHIEPLILYY